MDRSSQRRGLQIMRTQSTRKASGGLTGPEMYLRLTSLEMERARRAMERDRLLERIQVLDQRISMILGEQAELRQRIDQDHPAPNAPQASSSVPQAQQPSGFTY